MSDRPSRDRAGIGFVQSDRRAADKGDTARGTAVPKSLQRSSRQIASAVRRALTYS